MAAKSTYRLVLLLIIAVAIALISTTFKQAQYPGGPDEWYYFSNASFIAEKGLSGFSNLFNSYLNNKQVQHFPNPLRIGFLSLSALWLKIFGYHFIDLSYLSLFFYALFLFFSYYFSRKYLGERLALLFTILLAFSPLQLAMARRALIESAVNLSSVLSVWLFWDYLKAKSGLKLVLFILAYTCAILIKETSVLLVFVFLLFFLIDKYIYKNETTLKDSVFLFIVPVALVGLAYLALGCLPYVFDTVRIILNSPRTNSYAIAYGSGPWYRYLIDYILLSPWIVILSVGFIFYILLEKNPEQLPVYFIFIVLINFILFNIFTKNVRYVIILDMPMRLLSVLMLDKITRRLLPRNSVKLIFVLVIGIALFDYFNFHNLFIQENIYDPVSFMLLKAKHIIP